MTVAEVIERLSALPSHMEVQASVDGAASCAIRRVYLSEEDAEDGSEDFVCLDDFPQTVDGESTTLFATRAARKSLVEDARKKRQAQRASMEAS